MFGQSHESAPDLGDIFSSQGLLHVQCWHVMVHMECQQSMLILAWFVSHWSARLTVNGSADKLYLLSRSLQSTAFRVAGPTRDPLFRKGSVARCSLSDCSPLPPTTSRKSSRDNCFAACQRPTRTSGTEYRCPSLQQSAFLVSNEQPPWSHPPSPLIQKSARQSLGWRPLLKV